MEWPAQSLALQDPELSVINVHSQAKERYELAEKADLLVLFNTNDIDLIPIIERRKKNGLKTICELNDNFYEPQLWSPIAKEWTSNHLRATYELFLRNADQIMVTGEGLLNLFSKHTTTPITIIENNLPDSSLSLEDLLSKKKKRSFGWAGSLGHIADILSVAPRIKNYLLLDKDATFHVMGNESLASNLHLSERYFYTAWGRMDQYFDFWRSIEVGIIPLLNTPYNQCRSDIKLLEMVYSGTVPIVPHDLPYLSLIERFNIPSYRDLNELSVKIQEVIELPDSEKKEILSSFFKYIQDHRLQSNNKKRLEFYRKNLPQNPSRQLSNHSTGYSFFIGSENTSPNYVNQIAQCNALVKAQRVEEALQLLQNFIHESPQHSEYAVSYAYILARVNPTLADIFVSECVDLFENDIRFRALSLVLSDSIELASYRIRSVISYLAVKDKLFQRAAYQSIKRSIISLLEKMPQLIDIIEEILLLYPFSYQLRFKLAEQYEKLDRVKEARAHFDALRKAKEQFEDGANEIAEYDLGYITAWSNTLDARYSMKR
jgi:tetratricopeptide (TPR) repeat protein